MMVSPPVLSKERLRRLAASECGIWHAGDQDSSDRAFEEGCAECGNLYGFARAIAHEAADAALADLAHHAGLATGPGDTYEDLRDEIVRGVEEARQKAAAARDREWCAALHSDEAHVAEGTTPEHIRSWLETDRQMERDAGAREALRAAAAGLALSDVASIAEASEWLRGRAKEIAGE